MSDTPRALPPEYYVRARFPKWNVHPHVLMEPRLMRRLMPFATMSKADHLERAHALARLSDSMQKSHAQAVTRAEKKHGDHGALICGGRRPHWPQTTMRRIWRLAVGYCDLRDASAAHWQASGKRVPWRVARERGDV
jgi:hypothetical protein